MTKIDEYLDSLPEWQKNNLVRFRQAIHYTVPEIQEDWKWNVPVFLVEGKVFFAMSAFKAHTKYNFILNGALIDDPHKLFNNGLDSKKSRGIDLHEGETIDEQNLKKLIQASVDK
ncbi:MAG: hypothetical protein JWM00_743 [Candidatus Saccharibacteria bacterium]|nr:hypothetical protein [Candidatus Saccharibacteria bacterium]